MLPIPILLRLARRLETLWAPKPEPLTHPARAWASLRTQLAEAESLRWRIEQATARRMDCAAASMKQELSTLTSVDITHDADIAHGAEAIRQLVSGTKREAQVEKRYRHKDGRYICVRATGTVIPGGDQSPWYLLGLVEDHLRPSIG